ncbi:MAG TPA: TonB-dependent receptor [Patescibacteria group bacterium]|nr:TonB-dependent receptor [Patescibacteria group bacterium]
MSNHKVVEVTKTGVFRPGFLVRTPFTGAAMLVCLLLLSVSGAKAQNSADVYGVVTDPSGAAVPDAQVTITNTGTNVARTTTTSTGGNYSFALLSVGTYSVTIEAKGFKQFQAADITLAAGDHARVDAKMEVGAVTQSVVVSAATAPVLQTASSTVGTLITPTATQNLPLNGRNFVNLVQLSAGVNEGPQSSLSGGTRPDDRRLTSSFSAHGQSETVNNFILDGVDDNERAIATVIVKPSIDALREVKVDTSSYPASEGRAGGAVVIMTTESGTNNFHGDAFEFARNDVFDGKNYFNTGAKAPLSQHDFGGSFGGRIIKNKAFFFMDYEGLRVTKGQTDLTNIPSLCELGRATCNGVQQLGNFSDISTPIYIPGTTTQYDYNGIPNLMPPPGSSQPGAVTGISQNYAALYPTVSGCTVTTAVPYCTYLSSPSVTQTFDNADARVDYHIRGNQSMFARYTINNGNSVFPGAFPGVKVSGVTNYDVYGNGAVPIQGTFPGPNIARQQNLTIGWDDVVGPNFLVELRGSFSRYRSESLANNAGHNVNTDFGGPTGIDVPGISGMTGLALFSYQTDGYSSLGDQFALPTSYWDTDYQYVANFSWTHGAHTIKFGANVLRRGFEVGQQLFKGWFQFNANNTSGGNTGTGNSFASMLAGIPAVTIQSLNLNFPSYQTWEQGEYIQDDWQATQRLTLNLGVRYDIYTPFVEKHNAISNFDPTNLAMLLSGRVQVAGEQGVPRTTGVKTQRNMIQPRLGFAAVVGPSLVLRGGFGTTYFPTNSASQAYVRNQPWGYSVFRPSVPFTTPLLTPSIDPSLTCLVPACGASGSNSIADGMALNYQNGLMYMANLTLQKAFGLNSISVGWVGEYGRHLARLLQNADQPGPPATTGCTNVSLPGPCQPFYQYLPLTSSIQLLTSDGSSNYNGLSVEFTRRAAKGLTFQANYTYGQALDNTDGSTPCGTCNIVNPFNPRYDYGFSSYDVRHRVAITADYQLPFGKSLTGISGQAIKGWEVNAIYSFASGLPMDIADGLNTEGVTHGRSQYSRPNMVAARYANHTPIVVAGQTVIPWIDPTDFTRPAPGTEGNSSRNQLFGPSGKSFDFSLFKSFPIRESMRVQFRAEVFNLTNTPSFAFPSTGPGTTISAYTGGTNSPATTAGGFGQLTSTSAFYNPRTFQFAVKFMF